MSTLILSLVIHVKLKTNECFHNKTLTINYYCDYVQYKLAYVKVNSEICMNSFNVCSTKLHL